MPGHGWANGTLSVCPVVWAAHPGPCGSLVDCAEGLLCARCQGCQHGQRTSSCDQVQLHGGGTRASCHVVDEEVPSLMSLRAIPSLSGLQPPQPPWPPHGFSWAPCCPPWAASRSRPCGGCCVRGAWMSALEPQGPIASESAPGSPARPASSILRAPAPPSSLPLPATGLSRPPFSLPGVNFSISILFPKPAHTSGPSADVGSWLKLCPGPASSQNASPIPQTPLPTTLPQNLSGHFIDLVPDLSVNVSLCPRLVSPTSHSPGLGVWNILGERDAPREPGSRLARDVGPAPVGASSAGVPCRPFAALALYLFPRGFLSP